MRCYYYSLCGFILNFVCSVASFLNSFVIILRRKKIRFIFPFTYKSFGFLFIFTGEHEKKWNGLKTKLFQLNRQNAFSNNSLIRSDWNWIFIHFWLFCFMLYGCYQCVNVFFFVKSNIGSTASWNYFKHANFQLKEFKKKSEIGDSFKCQIRSI